MAKKLKIRGRELRAIGFPQGKAIGLAINAAVHYHRRAKKEWVLEELGKVLAQPEHYREDAAFAKVAQELVRQQQEAVTTAEHSLAEQPDSFPIYGAAHIEAGAKQQMYTAMRLPVAVAGALMPDAHHGYGLPIGGVLATDNAVIPYGVGVDIGCRMCLSIYPMAADTLTTAPKQYKKLLLDHTRFGRATHDRPMDDPIFARAAFKEIKVVRQLKDRAFQQIGSSGGGNHFVEFGVAEITDPANEFGVDPGQYLAVLSHSGSRGLGAMIARHYTNLAMDLCPLPKEARHLAWLSLDTEAGQEYWTAMTLAGDYASACHDHIHRRLAQALGEQPLTRIENHHNFAWKQQMADGREVIVHRKGATPAGKGELGIIPGSMTAPGFIVRGKGVETSLHSASHGAGRVMSRTQAKNSLDQRSINRYLVEHGVTLIGGGLDEAPMAYKDIHTVMAEQQELVDVVGTFLPKVVRMEG